MNYENGDVLLLSSEDGGELNIVNGLVEMTGGFETAIYLSLFGGNDIDNGSESTKKNQFWGNLLEDNDNFKMTSKTQNILTGFPATPNNLKLVNESILLDLNWMKTNNIIDDLKTDLSIPQKNKISITVEGKKNKQLIFNTSFEKNWIAQSLKN
jgi:hypothetical protein